MSLKTYRGATMAEALAGVKRDLGRDAVILQTRTIRTGGVLGIGGQDVVEITASSDLSVVPRMPRAAASGTGTPVRRDGLARMFGQPAAAKRTPSDNPPPRQIQGSNDSALGRLKEELAAIRGMVSDLVRQTRTARLPDLPEELFNAYLELLESEVAEELAGQIVQSLRSQLTGEAAADRRCVRDALVDCISRMIPTSEPAGPDEQSGKTKVIALVGPTGVGKTTTIAKLAARHKLGEGRRVGLVTIDTYRIAAVSQLATYARIIDVPLKVVLTAKELTDTVAEMSNTCDIVLVDTAGRSPNDAPKLDELGDLLAAARPDEVHLVLSSTCQPAAMRAAIERFSPLGVNRLILTKLDEAVSLGIVLQVVRQVDASLSYVTTGQDVPDDIEVGSARRLAKWIIARSLSDDSGDGPSSAAKAAGGTAVPVGEASENTGRGMLSHV